MATLVAEPLFDLAGRATVAPADVPAAVDELPAERVQRGGAEAGGSRTLEHVLSSAWEGLTATGAAACPVCAGRLARRPGTPEAACADCGTTIA